MLPSNQVTRSTQRLIDTQSIVPVSNASGYALFSLDSRQSWALSMSASHAFMLIYIFINIYINYIYLYTYIQTDCLQPQYDVSIYLYAFSQRLWAQPLDIIWEKLRAPLKALEHHRDTAPPCLRGSLNYAEVPEPPGRLMTKVTSYSASFISTPSYSASFVPRTSSLYLGHAFIVWCLIRFG